MTYEPKSYKSIITPTPPQLINFTKAAAFFFFTNPIKMGIKDNNIW